jgi:hypothetical protein
MLFANHQAFNDPRSRQAAMGVDLRPQSQVRDASGNVLFHLQTGGMINPQRCELSEGAPLMRFASGSSNALRSMGGGWWTEQTSFDRIFRFAQVHEVPIILAARILCGVPPEWSDMRLLVRVRLRRPMLAWRGLANTVVIPHPGGGPHVRMLHQNLDAERRLFQVYIPGLDTLPVSELLLFEREDRFSEIDSKRGWLYL